MYVIVWVCLCALHLYHICPCHPADILGHYMVYFFVEIFCEPAAPVRVIDVQCASGVSSENVLVCVTFKWNRNYTQTEWCIIASTNHFSSEAILTG